jgi:hypothetical protein
MQLFDITRVKVFRKRFNETELSKKLIRLSESDSKPPNCHLARECSYIYLFDHWHVIVKRILTYHEKQEKRYEADPPNRRHFAQTLSRRL